MLKPKILAIDLSGSESISYNPIKYGGIGRTFASLHKRIPNFWVMGTEGLVDLQERAIPLSLKDIEKIRNGANLENYISQDFDIIFYASPPVRVDYRKAKHLVWCPGQNEQVNALTENVLLHNKKTQNPHIPNLHANIFDFVLGVERPEFEEYKKMPYVFQCSNHFQQINSIALARACRENGMACYFAGPISENYNLLAEVDNICVFYLGEISESEKIAHLKTAQFFASLYGFPINETPLAIKQALSYGCTILTTQVGGIPDLIKNGENGHFIKYNQDFYNAIRSPLDQRKCYDSTDGVSAEKMAESFQKVISCL